MGNSIGRNDKPAAWLPTRFRPNLAADGPCRAHSCPNPTPTHLSASQRGVNPCPAIQPWADPRPEEPSPPPHSPPSLGLSFWNLLAARGFPQRHFSNGDSLLSPTLLTFAPSLSIWAKPGGLGTCMAIFSNTSQLKDQDSSRRTARYKMGAGTGQDAHDLLPSNHRGRNLSSQGPLRPQLPFFPVSTAAATYPSSQMVFAPNSLGHSEFTPVMPS